MSRALRDKSTELLSQTPTANSREVDSAVNRVDKDFERLKKDIQSLMKARQQSELQGQRELMKLLDRLEYAQTRITKSSNPVNEKDLRESEKRRTRRDWTMLGIGTGVSTLIALLLHFFG